jgi:serine/threonine-protein kinase
MPLADGATFAGYTIVRMLGSGGMGEVYLAQHPRLPRRDALKVLPTAVSADSEYRQRFNREADVCPSISAGTAARRLVEPAGWVTAFSRSASAVLS